MTARLALGLALLLGASVQAQTATSQPADSLVAAVPSSPAEALARVRQGLDADPDDAALLEQRLRLEIDGVGLGGVPEVLRRQQREQIARRLLGVDPGNPLAHDVLGRAALRDAQFFQDRVNVFPSFTDNDVVTVRADGVSPEYIRSRFLSGRLDIDALNDVFRVVDAGSPGRAAATDARAHFETALATDPAYRGAYEPFVSLLALTNEWPTALALARQATAQFPDDGQTLLWTGLAEYRTGDAAAAEATFDRALALLPLAERARFTDLTDLLTPGDAVRYRTDPEAFAPAFWSREDVRLLTPANERRAEHFARRAEADLRFGWSGARGAETDRGRIWARYGAPRRRTQFSGGIYPGDKQCELCPPDLYDVWAYDGFQFVFDDPNHGADFRTYSPSAIAFSDVSIATAASRDDYVLQDARLRREAPQQTSYAPVRRERVPLLATPFRGASGLTDLVVAYGVPLAARPTADAALRLRTGVFVLQDGASAPVAERRRVRASVAASETVAMGETAAFVGSEALSLTPGAYTVAAEFEGGGAVGYERSEVAVPTFGASGLQISGLLLAASADEGAAAPLTRGGYGIVPLPLAVVAAGQPVTVYAEAYGLGLASGRSDYAVELALVPADERSRLGRLFGQDRRRGVSTQTEAQGTTADDAVVVSVDTAGQPAGEYVLALRITDRVSGRTAEASRDVTIE